MNRVITRFAPSPTGFMHLGNVRTAFFSWLYAKKKAGKFLIRIDDTDFERSSKKYTGDILSILNWLKIKSEHPIIYQSRNYHIYKEFLIKLIKERKAYKCYCSKERLELLKQYQLEKKTQIAYDGFCKNISNKNFSENFIIRFINNKTGFVEFYDDVKGLIKISDSDIDDFIIAKNNYLPMYNFASVVDDINFNVSNIIRGEDHISNTPKQIKIMKAFNFQVPKFAHLPMILDDNKNLLSKRDQSSNIKLYKNNGFLPEAILNYIIKLGWSYKDKEIFSVKEMIDLFDFENINKSRCVINTKKLIWLNRYYMSKSSVKIIMKNLIPIEKKFNIDYRIGPNIIKLIEYSKNRVNNLKEIITDNLFFYQNILNLSHIFFKKYFAKKKIFIIFDIYKIFKNFFFIWNLNNIKNVINKIIIENNIKLYDIAILFRILITGSESPRPLYDLLYISGKLLILNRIMTIIRRAGL